MSDEVLAALEAENAELRHEDSASTSKRSNAGPSFS